MFNKFRPLIAILAVLVGLAGVADATTYKLQWGLLGNQIQTPDKKLYFGANGSEKFVVGSSGADKLTVDQSGNLSTSGTLTSTATGAIVFAVTGAPTNSATKELFEVGPTIAGGNTAANGGTYIGGNAPATGAGSAADWINLEANGTTVFKVDKSGNLTAGTFNGNTWATGTGTLSIAAGKTLTSSNTLTLAGTDSTTMTFPTTSATIARTDAGNTFTGHQTIEGVTSTGATGTGNLVFSASPTITGTLTATTISASGTATFNQNSGNAIAISGVPGNTATVSMLQVGGAIANGNISANGGTYIGGNAPAAGAGLTADWINLEANGSSVFKVSSGGNVTAGTYNGNTITTGTGTLTLAAAKTLTASNTLTLAGTDGTTMTFPTTSATLARTDAANTFTGHQTIEGVTSTGATGTGDLVFATSPTFTTPTLGAATATTINKVTVTQPATGSTLTINDGKVFQVTNSITLSGTDAQAYTFPAASDTVAGLGTAESFTKTQTFNAASGSSLVVSGTQNGAVNLGDTAVTQITSSSTGVTSNTASGVITTVSLTTAAGTLEGGFVVTCGACKLGSTVLVSLSDYSGVFHTNGIPVVYAASVGNGSFTVKIGNADATNALAGTVKVHYSVL